MDGSGTLKYMLTAGLLLSSEGFLNLKAADATSFVQSGAVSMVSSGDQISFIRAAYENYFSSDSRKLCRPTISGTPLNYALNPGITEVPSAFRPHCVEITSFGFDKKRVQTYPSGYSYGYYEGWVARDARVVVYPGCRVQLKYCSTAPKTHTDISVDSDPDWYPTLVPFASSPACSTGLPTVVSLNQPGVFYLPNELTPSTSFPDPLNGGAVSGFGAGLTTNPYVAPTTSQTGQYKSQLYLTGVQVDADSTGPVTYPCVAVYDRNQKRRNFALSPSSSIPLDFTSDAIPAVVGAAAANPSDQVADSLRLTSLEILPGCMLELSKVSPHQVVDDRVIANLEYTYTSALALHQANAAATQANDTDTLQTIQIARAADEKGEPSDPLSWRVALSPGKWPLRAFLRYALGSANPSNSGIDSLIPSNGAAGPSVAVRGLAVLPLVRLRLLAQKDKSDSRVFYGCLTHKSDSSALSLELCNGEGQSFAYATALGQLRPLRSGTEIRSNCLSFSSLKRNSDGSVDTTATPLDGTQCSLAKYCDRKGDEGYLCKPVLSKCVAKLVSQRTDNFTTTDTSSATTSTTTASGLATGEIDVEDLPLIADGGIQQVWQTKRVNCSIPAADNGKNQGFVANGFVVMTTFVDETNTAIEYCLTAVGEGEDSGSDFYVDPAEKAIVGDSLRLRRCGWFSSVTAPNGCPYMRQMFTLDFSILPDNPYIGPNVTPVLSK